MRNPFSLKAWSPYLVGMGIGMLSWFAFLTANHPLGITTAFEHTSAFILQGILPPVAEGNSYFEDHSPKIGWEWMLVVGVFLGALPSAWLSGDRTRMKVPPLWANRLGPRVGVRFLAAFLGAALMFFGARLAGGCTSGHGISGNLQLAVSSLVFTAIFFLVAIITSLLLYGREERPHG